VEKALLEELDVLWPDFLEVGVPTDLGDVTGRDPDWPDIWDEFSSNPSPTDFEDWDLLTDRFYGRKNQSI